MARRQMADPDFTYLSGFANHFATEAVAGTLPVGRNSPQKVAHGLYAEQLSGTAFTAPRSENFRSWLYRVRPSVMHGAFKKQEGGLIRGAPFEESPPSPNQMRWDPLPLPKEPTDFVQGLVTVVGNSGCAAHLYLANSSMGSRFFYDADGELLLVPQEGTLRLKTEMGWLDVAPGEIAVIPRGIRFQADPVKKEARGYVCENFGAPFRLPNLGPIGANGLANPRDFLAPSARFDESKGDFSLVAKFQGRLWTAPLAHNPLDVVAWHGNYYPYKYDLARFQAVNSVTFDHPDPSIFTVLTSPTDRPGVANVDFVIFPPRWLVAENTFRPPYFHRNVMSEYMGLIRGVYEAKTSGGFASGGGSLHNCMSAHGPDAESFEKASSAPLKPQYLDDALAFMFESSQVFHPTAFAVNTPALQKDYLSCWSDLKSHFQRPTGKKGT